MDHLEQIQAYRAILVEERRQRIATVFDLRKANSEEENPTSGANWGDQIAAIQEQIDAVDRAIADEGALINPRGVRSGGGGPLTVQDIRDAIHGASGDVEITFGSTIAGDELIFYRFKWRGDKLLQIELNEAD